MLVAMYALGVPLFAFLAWVFSVAVGSGEPVGDRLRVALLAGALWPVLLVGVAQLLGVRALVSIGRLKVETGHSV